MTFLVGYGKSLKNGHPEYSHHLTERVPQLQEVFCCDKVDGEHLNSIFHLCREEDMAIWSNGLVTIHGHVIVTPREWSRSRRVLRERLYR